MDDDYRQSVREIRVLLTDAYQRLADLEPSTDGVTSTQQAGYRSALSKIDQACVELNFASDRRWSPQSAAIWRTLRRATSDGDRAV